MRSVVLKPTDHFLRCHCRHPPAFISAERQHKKNCEKTSSFDDVTFFLTIFSINLLLLLAARHLWYLCPQINFCDVIAVTHLHSFQQSGSTKRTVRNHQVLMMLQFFLTIFSIKLLLSFLRPICGFCSIVSHDVMRI